MSDPIRDNPASAYEEYAKKCVDTCCKLMGEQHREFWETQCSWEEAFAENRDPEQVAQDEYEAMT